ncbi:ATP-binding response regulator [Trinickia fusca]|uniref:ATP-binding response regulator n=1 Tax=Trinickia fusca TaxID=2419777 RepID=UPI0016031A04|nr:hybrid sensor histidine kinase/response regulator [Trinickia fusca]
MADRVRAEQIAVLYRNTPLVVAGSGVTALILCALLCYRGHLSYTTAGAWIAVMLVSTVIRLLLWRGYARATPSVGDRRRWAHWFSVGSGVNGLTWGLGSLWLFAPARFEDNLLILFVLGAMGLAALYSLGSYLPAFLAFYTPCVIPPLIWVGLQGDPSYGGIPVFGAVYLVFIFLFARRMNATLVESLRLRFENLDLVNELREQRDLAYQANLAKSRFLASASHDLRQPMHALSLFVGALRARKMDDQARKMVDHIDDSIQSMNGLFTSLLDISRLDAGIVQPQLETFPIDLLLARLLHEFAPEAAEKGLVLRLHRCSLSVTCDPILLERVLRNLVANAVRYTSRGRIVIGCRRGERLRIEVWDMGPGIADEHREVIFQEFYQIENPERDRNKGLGLGLAIVKRLAALLDAPLTLRSHPGKGSCFSVSVTRAQNAITVRTLDVEPRPGTLAPRLVLVVDDEIAIQTAMTTLLQSWGLSVIAAGSGAEMLERTADCTVRPSLIICDYRLRDEEHGTDVIERLQAEYNEDIPGVLITGDTAPDRLREAQESGFLLLHKPVSDAKLRAAIDRVFAASDDEPVIAAPPDSARPIPSAALHLPLASD